MRGLAAVLTLGWVLFWATSVAASIDGTESTILVRQDCTGLDDCVEGMDDLASQIWATNNVRQGNALLVDIGPGVFEDDAGRFIYPPEPADQECGPNDGNITLRGRGREATLLKTHMANTANFFGNPPTAFTGNTIWIKGCEHMGFQDMSVLANGLAVEWNGGGSSTWTNVDLHSLGDGIWSFAWYDNANNDPNKVCQRAVHYFFGSRVVSENGLFNWAYASLCDENWFYGGDIVARTTVASGQLLGVFAWQQGDIRVFGSSIRVKYEASTSLPGLLFGGANALDGGVFHMHGGIINATSTSSADVSVIGVQSSGTGSLVHTPGTAFVIQPSGSGIATRVRQVGAGVAMSPFLWQSGATPPSFPPGSEAPLVSSTDGADIFVETDCAADGDCTAAGTQTHLMIYNETECPQEKWFDVVTGRCRNDTGP